VPLSLVPDPSSNRFLSVVAGPEGEDFRGSTSNRLSFATREIFFPEIRRTTSASQAASIVQPELRKDTPQFHELCVARKTLLSPKLPQQEQHLCWNIFEFGRGGGGRRALHTSYSLNTGDDQKKLKAYAESLDPLDTVARRKTAVCCLHRDRAIFSCLRTSDLRKVALQRILVLAPIEPLSW
jgi:hypothetical protein